MLGGIPFRVPVFFSEIASVLGRLSSCGEC
jgi:hypothetical protein